MRRNQRTSTIADVARLVGLGTATVSRVLNHQPRVSQKTRARVLEAIEVLGYKPNETARLLRGRTERLIGMVVPDLSNFFMAQCADAIQRAAQAEGYRILVACSENNLQTERLEMRRMKERGASGVLVVPCDRSAQAGESSEMLNFPVVALLRPLAGVKADTVVMDQSACTMAAVRQLIGLGCSRIAGIETDAESSLLHERESAFRQAMSKAGQPPHIIRCATTLHAVHAAVTQAVEAGCDALFCLAWQSTLYTVHSLRDLGAGRPQKLAIVGFDDCGLVRQLYPQVTTISASTADLSHAAVQQLMKLIDQPHSPAYKARRIMIPAKLSFSL